MSNKQNTKKQYIIIQINWIYNKKITLKFKKKHDVQISVINGL